MRTKVLELGSLAGNAPTDRDVTIGLMVDAAAAVPDSTAALPSSPGVSVYETHSAAVFFLGDHAYKVKKPVDLGFLDFTTPSARQAVCHRRWS